MIYIGIQSMNMEFLGLQAAIYFAFLLCLIRWQTLSALLVDLAPLSLRRELLSAPLCVFHNVNQYSMNDNMLDFLHSQPLFSFSMRNLDEEQHVLKFASLLKERQFKGTFGASSVQNIDQVKQLIDCGVNFFSTMHLIAPVVELCQRHNFPVLCGVHSLQDVQEAVSLGVELFKFYPVSTILTEEVEEMQEYIHIFQPRAIVFASGGVKASNAGLYVGDYGFDNVAIGLDPSKESLRACQATISETIRAFLQVQQLRGYASTASFSKIKSRHRSPTFSGSSSL